MEAYELSGDANPAVRGEVYSGTCYCGHSDCLGVLACSGKIAARLKPK